MLYKSLFLAALASTSLAAPVAAPAPQDGLLKGLSPDVVSILNTLVGPTGTLGGLGLGGISQPVGNVLNTASDDLKKRQDGLLKGLSPDVVSILNTLVGPTGTLGGLGLGGISQPVGNVLNTASDDLKKRSPQDGLLKGLSPDVVSILNTLVGPTGTLGGLGLGGISQPVGNVLNTASDDLKKRQNGLLSNLSPEVTGLLNGLLAPPSALSGLGLGGISAPVGGVVDTLGKGLKKRQDGLLSDLSPDVTALLNGLLAPPSALGGLGLGGISVPVGGVVDTLGKGL